MKKLNSAQLLDLLKEQGEIGFFSFANDKIFFFKFEASHHKPVSLIKLGNFTSIHREYENHKLAYSIIPKNVPKILFFKSLKKEAVICIEYIENKLLNDILASKIWHKEKCFIKEMDNLFHFFIIWLKKLPVKKIPMERVDNISRGIVKLHQESLDKDITNTLITIYEKLKTTPVPVAIQHRDFSVANVRYAKDRFIILDWEDLAKEDIAISDFAMLYFSLVKFYCNFFQTDILSFHSQKEIQIILKKIINNIISYLEIEKKVFDKIFILSLYSLWSQNLKKGRFATAKDLLRFLRFKMEELC